MAWLDKYKKWLRILVFGTLLFFLWPHMNDFSVDTIVNATPVSLPLAVLVFMLIYILKSLVMIVPITILWVAAGIIFPVYWAIVVSYLGLMLSLNIGYEIGNRLGEKKVNAMLANHKRIANFLEGRKENLVSLCFIYRLLPLPFDMFNLLCGALKMPFWKYMLVSLLGISAKMIPFVLAGSALSNPLSVAFLLPFGISFTIIISVFLVYRKLIAR